jgi:hypothetical protein
MPEISHGETAPGTVAARTARRDGDDIAASPSLTTPSPSSTRKELANK